MAYLVILSQSQPNGMWLVVFEAWPGVNFRNVKIANHRLLFARRWLAAVTRRLASPRYPQSRWPHYQCAVKCQKLVSPGATAVVSNNSGRQ